MNELQRVELELLKNFIEACDKLGLHYYLVCGTALGAAKYGGFIPWDDDIDVALCRKEYEIFCEKAQDLLPENVFLQTYKTDKKYPCIFAKLRKSNTTYIENSYRKLPINHGVYIDVFPLDGYPKSIAKQKRLERKKFLYKLELASVFEMNCSWKAKMLMKAFRFYGFHKKTDRILSKYEKMISAYPVEASDVWCNHGNWQGRLEYAPKEQYGNGVMVSFEGVKVRIPEKYDDYLTQKYGDWRSELPQEEQKGHHYYSVMDLNRPYTEYV